MVMTYLSVSLSRSLSLSLSLCFTFNSIQERMYWHGKPKFTLQSVFKSNKGKIPLVKK